MSHFGRECSQRLKDFTVNIKRVLYVWPKWRYIFGQSGAIFLAKVVLYFWAKWCYISGQSGAIFLGKVVLYFWAMWSSISGQRCHLFPVERLCSSDRAVFFAVHSTRDLPSTPLVMRGSGSLLFSLSPLH